MRLIIPDEGYYSTGIETVAISLARALAGRVERLVWVLPEFRRDEFSKLIPESEVLRYELDFQAEPGWRKIGAAAIRRLAGVFGKSAENAMQRTLRRCRYRAMAKKHGATHALYFTHLNQTRAELGIPTGLVVYDLHWRRFPGDWAQPASVLDADLKRWLRRSTRLFAISRQTREEMESLEPACHEKTMVIMLAAQGGDPPPVVEKKREYPVLLYPSSVRSHKGHDILLRAMVRAAHDGSRFKVVLTGNSTVALRSRDLQEDAYKEECRKYYHEHRNVLADRLECRGHVTTQQLENLYATADAVILPSRYEGFGLPLLEGVAQGLAVICSDIPAFQEQVEFFQIREQVALFESGNADALADAITAFATAHPGRKQETPPAAIRSWTWDSVADRVVEWLDSVPGEP